jgi:pimeloyl-ACP methyl ester carboxylesterase
MQQFTESGGHRIAYRVHSAGTPTVVLMPTWPIVDSQHWKAQVPYLSRHFRVITYDPLGNGLSDRPTDPRPTPTTPACASSSPSWTRPAPTPPCWPASA